MFVVNWKHVTPECEFRGSFLWSEKRMHQSGSTSWWRIGLASQHLLTDCGEKPGSLSCCRLASDKARLYAGSDRQFFFNIFFCSSKQNGQETCEAYPKKRRKNSSHHGDFTPPLVSKALQGHQGGMLSAVGVNVQGRDWRKSELPVDWLSMGKNVWNSCLKTKPKHADCRLFYGHSLSQRKRFVNSVVTWYLHQKVCSRH